MGKTKNTEMPDLSGEQLNQCINQVLAEEISDTIKAISGQRYITITTIKKLLYAIYQEKGRLATREDILDFHQRDKIIDVAPYSYLNEYIKGYLMAHSLLRLNRERISRLIDWGKLIKTKKDKKHF